jgi:hypothetical protein
MRRISSAARRHHGRHFVIIHHVAIRTSGIGQHGGATEGQRGVFQVVHPQTFRIS